MPRFANHIYIFITIFLTVYSQLVLKINTTKYGSLPLNFTEKIKFLISLSLSPPILSCYIAAVFASFAWMAAMTKFELSYAYPFMSLNFVIVLMLSGWLLNEPVTLQKAFGVALIVFGTIVAARG